MTLGRSHPKFQIKLPRVMGPSEKAPVVSASAVCRSRARLRIKYAHQYIHGASSLLQCMEENDLTGGKLEDAPT